MLSVRPSVKLLFVTCAVIASLLLAQHQAFANHDQPVDRKDAILLVAFGSSVPEAQVAFENVGEEVKALHPDAEIRWAYTSHIIRDILNKRGNNVLSPAQALVELSEQGYTHVAIQSLHTIPGQEFEDLVHTVHALKRGLGFEKLTIGEPLLSSNDDMHAAAKALIANIPTERKADEAVVFMGHGTHHTGNVYYVAMQEIFSQYDAHIFVGTVEGAPTLDDVQKDLTSSGAKRVWLMPMMSVAGDHARNDMAGDESDSWKSILTAAGYSCVPVLKGTAEFDAVVAIWLNHLDVALKNLK